MYVWCKKFWKINLYLLLEKGRRSCFSWNKIYRKKAEDDSIVVEAYKRNPVVCHTVSLLDTSLKTIPNNLDFSTSKAIINKQKSRKNMIIQFSFYEANVAKSLFLTLSWKYHNLTSDSLLNILFYLQSGK